MNHDEHDPQHSQDIRQQGLDLLVRLDERTSRMKEELERVEDTLKEYVTRIEFWPVKIMVFGLAGLILSAVIAALIAGVLRR